MDSIANYLIQSKIKSTSDGLTKSVFGDEEEEKQSAGDREVRENRDWRCSPPMYQRESSPPTQARRKQAEAEQKASAKEEAARREKADARKAEHKKKNDEIRARYGLDGQGGGYKAGSASSARASGSSSSSSSGAASGSGSKEDCVVM